MKSTVMDFKFQTIETNTSYPIVCISAEVMIANLGKIRCIDTGSLRDQIENAVVSTIAIVEKCGAKAR